MGLFSFRARVGAIAVALAAVAGAVAVSTAARGAERCAPDPRIAPTVRQWIDLTPIPNLTFKDAAEARCFQRAFLKALKPRLGARVGYKVGLYSQAARKAYRTTEPRLGYLHAKMMRPAGATVPAAYGVAGTWESDLLVVVRDAGINTARTREELYAGLRGFRPFIELPNRNYAADVDLNADQVEALNVGARLGVIGDEAPLPPGPAGMQALLNTSAEVTVSGPAGTTVDRGKAPETLGDIIDIVRFARDAALRDGHRLKRGDLISIGVLTPARAPVAGQTVSIRYSILPQPTDIAVTFN